MPFKFLARPEMQQAVRTAKSGTSRPLQKAAHGQRVLAQSSWQTGLAHARRNEWDAARRAFQRATQADPGDPVFALNLARALLALHRLDDAALEAARAFNLDPHNAVACAFTAHCLMEGKRFRDAARCLRSLPADVERGHDYHYTLARAL